MAAAPAEPCNKRRRPTGMHLGRTDKGLDQRLLLVVLGPLGLTVCAGCGPAGSGPDTAVSSARATAAPPATSPASPTSTQALHTGTGTVLESPEHGPELCLCGVAESFPPQCGGVPLRGWDWAEVQDEQSANGTTWGSYSVTGGYDGSTLTLTEPPTPPRSSGQDPALQDPFPTPCPVPEGGWRVVGPGPTGQEGVHDAQELAGAAPDFAGLWIDQPPPGDAPETPPPPEQVVLNVAFTGDLERHEAELRRVWAGPLCVSELPRPYSELTRIQDELVSGGVAEQLGLQPLGSGSDQVRSVVQLLVVSATPEQQAAIEERYGDAVELTPGLQPVG